MKNFKKPAIALSALIALLAVTGCERSDIGKTGIEISGGDGRWESVCIDGVEYISFGVGYRAGITVKLDQSGNVVVCDR